MTFLAFFVSLPFCLYAQQSNQKKLANEEGGGRSVLLCGNKSDFGC